MTRTTDEELLAAVRAGEPHAFQDLRDRHWPTAVTVARLHTPSRPDAEQLAGTAVDQALADLPGGEGPEVFLRARLVEVVGRAGAEPPRAAEAVSRVYLGLPASWQAVLWHTEVEGLPLGRTAELLGLSPAATTALHLEARAGLRAAYRQTKLNHPLTGACEECAGDLGAFVDGSLPTPRLRAVEAHLDDCPRCTADLLYLQDTEAGLRGWVLPVLAGVPLWGDAAGALGELVRAAGRESAARPAAAPGADLAGGSLAAVGAARRGRRVLLGAGALAAAAALAGVAVTGQGGLGDGSTRAANTQAQEGDDGAAAPAPSVPAAASSPAPATEPGDSASAPEAGDGTTEAGGPQTDAVEAEDTQKEAEDTPAETEGSQTDAEDARAETEDLGDSGWPVRSGDVLVLEPSPVPARPAAVDADPAEETSTPARSSAPDAAPSPADPSGEGSRPTSGPRGSGTTAPRTEPDPGATDPAGSPTQDPSTGSPGEQPVTPSDPPGTPPLVESSPPAPESPPPASGEGRAPDGDAVPDGAATAPND